MLYEAFHLLTLEHSILSRWLHASLLAVALPSEVLSVPAQDLVDPSSVIFRLESQIRCIPGSVRELHGSIARGRRQTGPRMMRRFLMVMDPCYRAEILLVQAEIVQLHVADRSFQIVIAKAGFLFDGFLVNLQSPVSKMAVSNGARLNVPCFAPRALR